MLKDVSIRIKILIAQVFLTAMVSVFIYGYYPNQQKKAALDAIDSKIKSIRDMFSIGVGIGMGDTDLVAVSEALEWAHADSSVVYISVIDNNQKKIAFFKTGELTVPMQVAQRTFGKNFQAGKVIYYKTTITYQNLSFGELVIGYSLKRLETDITQLRLTTLYFCCALFAAGLVLSVLLSNMITRNIRLLDNTVKAVSRGHEHVFVEVKTNDEIGKLSRAFNNMLHRLDKSRREQVRYLEQLKKQNEELNQFSYVVSHDLKAPLRAIFKLSEWIEEDCREVLPEQSKKNLQTLRGRVFRLEALINGLLEYSKIGRTNVPLERTETQQMLKETIDMLNPPAHIKINIEKGMPVFKTKKLLFQQVFLNLLSNAIKYNDKPEGLIHIWKRELNNRYQFTVQDNGIGINAAYHEKIFDIFQTLEARDTIEGTGVGLSIIKKSVEEMGGTISLESEEGKGSKFTFTWPKEPATTEQN